MEAINIIGRVAICETKTIGENKFFEARVAVSTKYKGTEKTNWYSIVGSNLSVAQYLTKGKLIYVSGIPAAQAYINKEGKAIPVQRIYINRMEFLGGGKNEEQQEADTSKNDVASAVKTIQQDFNATPQEGSEDDLPF